MISPIKEFRNGKVHINGSTYPKSMDWQSGETSYDPEVVLKFDIERNRQALCELRKKLTDDLTIQQKQNVKAQMKSLKSNLNFMKTQL